MDKQGVKVIRYKDLEPGIVFKLNPSGKFLIKVLQNKAIILTTLKEKKMEPETKVIVCKLELWKIESIISYRFQNALKICQAVKGLNWETWLF